MTEFFNEAALVDDFNDEAREYLNILQENSSWSSVKKEAQSALKLLLKEQRYIQFHSTYKRYGVSTVGASYLYDVPLYKQGNLSPFRGKRVRIVCVGSGRHTDRVYMAGVVADTPTELIVTKLVMQYTFPLFADSLEIIYKSRRFRVVSAPKKLSLMSSFRDSEAVDFSNWEAILLDGKLNKAIAVMRNLTESKIEVRHLRWHPSVTHEYPSIRAAIDGMAY